MDEREENDESGADEEEYEVEDGNVEDGGMDGDGQRCDGCGSEDGQRVPERQEKWYDEPYVVLDAEDDDQYNECQCNHSTRNAT